MGKKIEEFINKIILDSYSDPLQVFKELSDESVDCVVTSPPYWGLRNYNNTEKTWGEWVGQLGLELTFDLYIKHLCDIFDEIKRALKSSGTCWVNIGDTYANTGVVNKSKWKHKESVGTPLKSKIDYPSKCLIGIPFRFALEMINRGWVLRNTIIWHKPNAMPSSVDDRFTVDFEYVFFFVKSKKYYFEQQFEPYTNNINRWGGEDLKDNVESKWDKGTGQNTYRERNLRPNLLGRNKRCVWSIPTKGYKGAHFAVFPETLVEPCIKAGCPENGIVLDPFFGSGTTGVVAKKLNRNWIGIDCVPEYCQLAKERIGDAEIIELKNSKIIVPQVTSIVPVTESKPIIEMPKVEQPQPLKVGDCSYTGKCLYRDVDGNCSFQRYCKSKVKR